MLSTTAGETRNFIHLMQAIISIQVEIEKSNPRKSVVFTAMNELRCFRGFMCLVREKIFFPFVVGQRKTILNIDKNFRE